MPWYEFDDDTVSLATKKGVRDKRDGWSDYRQRMIRDMDLEVKAFMCKRGDTFIWHGGLLHGGLKVKDEKRDAQELRRALQHGGALHLPPSHHEDEVHRRRGRGLARRRRDDRPHHREQRVPGRRQPVPRDEAARLLTGEIGAPTYCFNSFSRARSCCFKRVWAGSDARFVNS